MAYGSSAGWVDGNFICWYDSILFHLTYQTLYIFIPSGNENPSMNYAHGAKSQPVMICYICNLNIFLLISEGEQLTENKINKERAREKLIESEWQTANKWQNRYGYCD